MKQVSFSGFLSALNILVHNHQEKKIEKVEFPKVICSKNFLWSSLLQESHLILTQVFLCESYRAYVRTKKSVETMDSVKPLEELQSNKHKNHNFVILT